VPPFAVLVVPTAGFAPLPAPLGWVVVFGDEPCPAPEDVDVFAAGAAGLAAGAAALAGGFLVSAARAVIHGNEAQANRAIAAVRRLVALAELAFR
jgi:hypothetical protein